MSASLLYANQSVACILCMHTRWHTFWHSFAHPAMLQCAQHQSLPRPQARWRTRSCLRVQCKASKESDAKRAAARAAVDRFVKNNAVVGLGSGDMVALAVEFIGTKLENGELRGVICVPASTAAASEAAFHGVPLSNLDVHPQVEVLLEEADQIDPAGAALLTGIRAAPQQPELPRLVAMLPAARQLVVLVEKRNVVPRLCASLPVFINSATWEETAEELDDIFLGDAEIWRRPTSGTANPRGGDRPYLSPEGCHVVDVRFYEGLKLYGEDAAYQNIATEVEGVAGVMAHGLISTMRDNQFTYLVIADSATGEVEITDAGSAVAAGSSAAAAAAGPPSGGTAP